MPLQPESLVLFFNRMSVNYPAVQAAAETTTGELVRLAGANIPDTIKAIGSVMPIDFFVKDPLYHIWPSKGLEMPPLGLEVDNVVILTHSIYVIL
jgi:L-fucose mutarotase/ribose pyranase (RbsD/FucU family)